MRLNWAILMQRGVCVCEWDKDRKAAVCYWDLWFQNRQTQEKLRKTRASPGRRNEGGEKESQKRKGMNYSLVEDEKVKVRHLGLWWDYFEHILKRLHCKFYMDHISHFWKCIRSIRIKHAATMVVSGFRYFSVFVDLWNNKLVGL